MRIILTWISAAFVFGTFTYMVHQKEVERSACQTVYLELAPRDPRSPMQGDYMALGYTITNQMNHLQLDGQTKVPSDGTMVILVDDKSVGQFVRIHQNEPLAPGEHLIKFHHDNWAVAIGAEKFFIPEGTGDTFAKAVYGEVKLSPDGTPLLIALCDKKHQPISAPSSKL